MRREDSRDQVWGALSVCPILVGEELLSLNADTRRIFAFTIAGYPRTCVIRTPGTFWSSTGKDELRTFVQRAVAFGAIQAKENRRFAVLTADP